MKYRPILGLLLFGSLVPLAIAEQSELPQPVRHILDIRNVPHDSLSVYVQDVDSGEVVLSWQDDVPRNPASTMKLLTTLVGLDTLGRNYRWTTDVFALGEVEDGRLDGDLLIRGGGDPFLVTERVWQMLRLVRQAGIHEIDGNLLIDDSYFEVPEYDPAEFDRQPLRAYNVGPNALLMNFKVVRYWFEPDHDRNAVRVWVDPPLENLRVENRLALRRGYCGGYQRGITITANEAIDKMIFSGRFPTGCKSYAMDRTALSHNEFAYGLFTSVWRESGGVFRGGWMNAKAPEDAEPIVSFRSLPLAEIISRVNKNSNNVMARHILYTMSAEVLGPPGTESGGRKVVENWLADTGIEFPTAHARQRRRPVAGSPRLGTGIRRAAGVRLAQALHAGVSRLDGGVRARRHAQAQVRRRAAHRAGAPEDGLARPRRGDRGVFAGKVGTALFRRHAAQL